MCAECLSMVRCRESVIKPRKNKDIQGKTKICKIKLKCSWFATATSGDFSGKRGKSMAVGLWDLKIHLLYTFRFLLVCYG